MGKTKDEMMDRELVRGTDAEYDFLVQEQKMDEMLASVAPIVKSRTASNSFDYGYKPSRYEEYGSVERENSTPSWGWNSQN